MPTNEAGFRSIVRYWQDASKGVNLQKGVLHASAVEELPKVDAVQCEVMMVIMSRCASITLAMAFNHVTLI